MTRSIVALLIACALAQSASADSEPWKVGVTPEQMEQARVLLERGNELFLEGKHVEALQKYSEALESWDHPGIRFNMVRSLVQLDRVVDAYENLERSLRYGAAPLEDTVYREALAYQKLLANQIAKVTIDCAATDTVVTLDGQPIECAATRRIVPGHHQVVGKRTGFATRTIELTVLGGKDERVRVELSAMDAGTRVVHRWPTWLPWTVFGSGFAIAAVGGLVQSAAISKRDDYYAALRECGATGCPPGYSALSFRDTALTYNRVAIGLWIGGGATVAAGVVMLVMNRGRTVPNIEPAPGGATIGVSGRF